MTDAQLTYTVQVDVSGGNFGAAFSATDVTSKSVAGLGFSPITVAWGRQDQFGTVTPTTVTGEFQNSDGTFTPGNSASTYYPHIRRNLRRRVIVGVNSTTVNVSEDYASSIEVVPSNVMPAVTSVSGADILARFGESTSASDVSAPSIGTTLRSMLAEEMLVDSPTALFMMQEADGATSFADVTGNFAPGVVVNSKYGAGTVTAGQTPAGTFQAGTAVQLVNPAPVANTASAGSWIALPGPNVTVAPFSLELWVQTPSTIPSAALMSVFADTNPTSGANVSISSTGGFLNTSAVASGVNVCDGLIHQIVLTWDGTHPQTLYLDGVAIGTGTSSNTGTSSKFTLGMLTTGIVLGNPPQDPFSGMYAYVGFYASTLSAARVAAHYNAGVTTFAGERTDQRITRLLSYRTNTGSSLDTGLGTMGLQSIQGRSLQDCLFEVGQVESGAVFTDGLGQVNFRSRSRLFNPTPTVTLDMKVGGVDFGSNWREDTQNVLNDVTVTNSTTGSDQRAFSASSITTDGEYSTSVSLPLNSDVDAANLAGWMVANGTQAQLTAVPLVINLLHLTAAQAQAVLSLKPLDCLQLTNCPTPAPSATMTFIVEGGTTSLAADAASVTLNVTPTPYPVGVWDSTNWDAAGVTWAF